MRSHLGWIRLAAVSAVLVGGPHAIAQVAPYRPLPQPPTTPVAGASQQQVTAPQRQQIAPQQQAAAAAGQAAYAPYYPQVPQQTVAPRQSIAPQQSVATPYRAPATTPYPRVATAYPHVASTNSPAADGSSPTAYPQSPTDYSATANPYSPTANPYAPNANPYAAAANPYTASANPYSPTAGPYSPSTYPQAPTALPPAYAPAGYPQTADRYSPFYSTVAQESDAAPPVDQGDQLPPPAAPVPTFNGAPTSAEPLQGTTNGVANGHDMRGGVNGTNGAMTPLTDTKGYSIPGHSAAACEEDASWSSGISGYFDNPNHDAQWFGGIYWLFMNRDDAEFRRLAAQFDTPAGYPYYPTADTTALSTSHADYDYRSGVEIRFGSSFATGGGDACQSACGSPYGYSYGCNNCNVQQYAWELGYWFLDDDVNTAQVIDSIPNDTNRIYGMMNFAGLLYNGEPVNLWYDYQVPVEDPTGPPPWGSGTLVRVLAQRVRTNFQAHNLELNFFRLPMFGAGCGTTGAGDCAPACGSPFSMTTLCGLRYMRLDDDFQYATMWAIDDGTGTLTPPAYTPWDGVGELYYDVNVDNHLAGFQLGANMNYGISCKWNVFWNTNFGLYNNHIDMYQRVYGDLGPATWAQSGEDAVVRAKKDDVAFVGEMLLGTSYQFTCNWRGTLAYRAVALSGVALSVDQIPQDFANEAQVALIDSNGSLVIHGLQIGAECRY